jgi:hypothetical protein
MPGDQQDSLPTSVGSALEIIAITFSVCVPARLATSSNKNYINRKFNLRNTSSLVSSDKQKVGGEYLAAR